jgi:D-threo-aldose 1-dehydrogenase
MNSALIPRFLDLAPIDFFLVALRYTLLDQRSLDVELPQCAKQGCGIVVGGAFNSGVLASGAVSGAKYDYAEAPSEILERVSRIEAICQRHAVSLIAAALQFPLGHPLVASVIAGAVTPTQVSQNVEAMRHRIPMDFWEELKREGLLRADAPVPAD